ncbi:hypothetical protein HZ326_16458 [Fusarium oxysporum f. sp. albedinis]|nr:hypothetical protein HZ326_16458 [Fusarium oxysporum f. sp. albedinis]
MPKPSTLHITEPAPVPIETLPSSKIRSLLQAVSRSSLYQFPIDSTTSLQGPLSFFSRKSTLPEKPLLNATANG